MTNDHNIDITILQRFFDESRKKREDIDQDAWRYLDKLSNLPDKVDEYDAEFERLTGIQKKDWNFLIFASILQGIRLVISDLLKNRLPDKESAQKTPFHNNNEHSDRRQKRYYATIKEIDSNPVPFDTVLKSELVKRNYPELKLSGLNHRFKTAGHDVFLGLVFGTANIMTKTITVNNGGLDFDSYHVQTGIAYYTRNNKPVIRDIISNRASTSMVFLHIIQRIKNEGKDGWIALAHAMGKEIVHLLSDTRTLHSLPLPLVSAVSPNMARIMHFCGLDTWNATMFGIDFLFTKWINLAIASLHACAYDEAIDGAQDLYEIRTQRIILLSNEIMMGCSSVLLAARICMGDVNAGIKFDFGGTTVALKQLWEIPQFIEQVKHEYISSKLLSYLRD